VAVEREVCMMSEKISGKVQVYTGNGKGKTTAAIGLTVRALGHGKKVLFVSLMKGYSYVYGEEKVFSALESAGFPIVHRKFGTDYFVDPNDPDEKSIEEARKGLEFVLDMMKKEKFDIVVVDEINVAVHFNLLSLDDVKKLIEEKPEDTELILTGRYAAEEIKEMADLVTEMCEIKHYFRDGVPAREGIEY